MGGNVVAVAVVVALVLVACSDGDDAVDDHRPLQPLIYTEDPDLSLEGAAVRERRLMRQLLEGSHQGVWGRLDVGPEQNLKSLNTQEQLGEAIVDALLERDEQLWSQVFVSGTAYAAFVGLDSVQAQEFVDNQMGESLAIWELFARTHPSEIPKGGLRRQLRFQKIELGSPRRLDGSQASDDEEAAQYWNNRVVVEHVDFDVQFELRISRIFRLPDPEAQTRPEPGASEDGSSHDFNGEDEEPAPTILRVGSAIEADTRFQTFLEVGLHLKPQLLRAGEYPFPLGVGTFWRYRRYDRDEGIDDDIDPLERRLDDSSSGLSAQELIVEVRDVSRYGPIRLIELLSAYDDRHYTRVRQWWVVTARRIYICNQTCRERIDDMDWLISYVAREAPIIKFPLQSGDRWGGDDSSPGFVVDDDWHPVDGPAGSFSATYRIEGNDDPTRSDRYLRDANVIRYFAPRRGVVRREIETGPLSEEDIDIVEQLVEYRLMN